MDNVFRTIKQGFKDGLKSFGQSMDLNAKPRFDYQKHNLKADIEEIWDHVGDNIEDAMWKIERDPEFQEAYQDHASYDARQNYLDDERRRKESKRSEEPPFLKRID